MLLDTFPLQGKLRNHRYYFLGCSAVEKHRVANFARNLIKIFLFFDLCFYDNKQSVKKIGITNIG